MHVSPRRLVSGCYVLALALSTGCSSGEDGSASSFGGSFTASQASQVTSASQVTTEDTGAGTTGESATGQAVSVTEASGATTSDPSAGTTGEPVTTEPATTEPATTEPATTEPATTGPSTTGPDPSTTDADPSTTTGMTTMTTMEGTTGEPPPPPPPKDPQPANGLYETCIDNTPCDPALTDACFMISDANMKVYDGYCTILCTNVSDCGPAPNAPAIQECFAIGPNQKVCGLKCKGVVDCPTGMACTNLALPNNQSGMYCI